MTLGNLLDVLKLRYTHVVVRRRLEHGYLPLGGGFADSVSRRFGTFVVERAEVLENTLVVYVL